MPKDPDLEKYTLNLRRGDIHFLTSLARPRGLQVSHIIRTLISQKVDELQAKVPQAKAPDIEGVEL